MINRTVLAPRRKGASRRQIKKVAYQPHTPTRPQYAKMKSKTFPLDRKLTLHCRRHS